MDADNHAQIEEQIAQWRAYLLRHKTIHTSDVEELESHLQDQIDELIKAGLKEDEAFLIAVKRMGDLNALSCEFAREHSDRLWKQLVLSSGKAGEEGNSSTIEILIVFGLAIAAGLAIKIPELFGIKILGSGEVFYMRNYSLFVLPFLSIYFIWKRKLNFDHLKWLFLPYVAAMLFANVYPFKPHGSIELLTSLHLPIALWLVIGYSYVGGLWQSPVKRMDFIRFTGELFIYYILIALGGGVLTGFTVAIFSFIGINLQFLAFPWILLCGSLGGIIVSAWLVESKKSVIENMAPVLTKIFTPLFTIMFLAFLCSMILTGHGIQVKRDVLIGFDLLLVLVLGLLLYAVSARNPEEKPNLFDITQLVLVISALIIDGIALIVILWRISEFGFSANKVAALGENLILLVNLAWSAWLYFCFLLHRSSFANLERWQTNYLPVYSLWAGIVVIFFPMIFGYA